MAWWIALAGLALLIVKLVTEMAENRRLRAVARGREEVVARLSHEADARSRALSGLDSGAQSIQSRLDALEVSRSTEQAETARLAAELVDTNAALLAAQRAAQQAALDLQRAQRAEAVHRRDAREAARAADLAAGDRTNALAGKASAAAAAADAERARRQALDDRDAAISFKASALQERDLAMRERDEARAARGAAESAAAGLEAALLEASRREAEAAQRETVALASLEEAVQRVQHEAETRCSEAAADAEAAQRALRGAETLCSEAEAAAGEAQRAQQEVVAETLGLLAAASAVVEEVRWRHAPLELQLASSRQEVAALEARLTSQAAQEEGVARLKSELADLHGQYDALSAERLALETRVDEGHAASISDLELRLQEAQVAAGKAGAEAAEFKTQVEEMQEARRENGGAAQAGDQEGARLRKLNAMLLSQIAGLKRELAEARATDTA